MVVLRNDPVDGQIIPTDPSDDFATDLKQRPRCWVKIQSSEPGKCPPNVARIYKGECYVANWDECAKYY
ncbi:hypothetical protein KRR26_32520 [Corallococcus sp. M34]|uniref:hypothetical protein n=1 Tax=Citreicoccus inhibens TaxID=2849499 RepID=UPI0011C3DB1A|nr:hypothetical protein [Citreicoccus inhibens]MBU8900343.1 hypothetical protein [Citreicoccus inhibens]